MRWQYYVSRLGWNVPWRPSVSAFLASFAFTATPGKAGEVVKSVLLRTSHDVPLSDGVGVLLVERLGDLLAVLILAVGGLALLTDATIYFVGTAIVVAAATVFFSNRWIYYPVLRQFAKIKKLAGVVEKVLRALDTCRSLLRPIPFLLGVGIALVAWSCEGLAFHLIIRSFGLECGILESFSIYGVATLVGALSALPGGLGTFEAVAVGLLVHLGLSLGDATIAIVIFRLCSLWLGSLIGVLFMLGWMYVMGSNSRLQGAGNG